MRLSIMYVFLTVLLCALNPLIASAKEESNWARAIGPRAWKFPRDHGVHPQYRTEWWYFTGNLSDNKGGRYGYQLTFFRFGVRLKASDPENPWSVRDLYLAHFAITDGSTRRFWWSERMSRPGPALAGAATDGMNVWLLSWSATMKGSKIYLKARDADRELSLVLNPRKPVILHGEHGLSKKGKKEGQASYYASFTDLETNGFLKPQPDGPGVIVKGRSWFDHEFGSNQLASDQEGWDWFSLHLSDGRDLMAYLLRRKDGLVEAASSGTLVENNGTQRHLELSDILVSVLDRWQSQKSGGVYPSRWRLQIPSARIDLVILPLLADQELNTGNFTGIVYWEGSVTGKGRSEGQNVSCEGYVELTGYVGTLGGIF